MLNFFAGVLRLFNMTFNAALQVDFFAFLIYTLVFLLSWVFFWFLIRESKRL